MPVTQMDVENLFGALNVAQWSSFELATRPSVNMVRLQAALNYADAWVNSKLASGPYTIPMPVDPPEVVQAKATVAGVWLWRSRGLTQTKETTSQMDQMMREAQKVLLEIKTGTRAINAPLNTLRMQTPFVVG